MVPFQILQVCLRNKTKMSRTVGTQCYINSKHLSTQSQSIERGKKFIQHPGVEVYLVVHVQIHIYIYISIYLSIYIYIYIYICIDIYIYMDIYIYGYKYIYIWIISIACTDVFSTSSAVAF